MDKRKVANQLVKDRLLNALIELGEINDWSKVTISELIIKSNVARASFYRNFKSVEEIIDYGIQKLAIQYHQNNPSLKGDVHNHAQMVYKFRFYKEHAKIVLAFHHAKVSTSLLDIITDCIIDERGDMPISSIHRYELYYYAGAFYNMILVWLENGAKESPEEMADEFLRIVQNL